MFSKYKHTFLLMAALGAMSAGGFTSGSAEAAPALVHPDDGKIRLQNTETEQLCEFDTMDSAREFFGNVADSHNWEHVQNGVVQPANVALAQAPESAPATTESASLTGLGDNQAASASPTAADIPTLTEAVADAPAAQVGDSLTTAPAGTTEAAD